MKATRLLINSFLVLGLGCLHGNDYPFRDLVIETPAAAQTLYEEVVESIFPLEFTLHQQGESLLGRTEAGEPVAFTLATIPGSSISQAGLLDLQAQMADGMNKLGYLGVLVIPSPDQVDLRTGEDYRQDRSTLSLQIWVSEVSSVRTVGKGVRVGEENPIDHPKHSWILKRSPVQVADAEGPVFLQRRSLETFIERLNQLPSRRVDLAISSAGEPGKVVMDYIVNEAKPWLLYAQVSNTGTESTGEWRQRFGGVHNQLTGNDDIITVDYLTASFDRAHAVSGSYEIPLWKPNYLKFRGYGSYSDFAAENLVVRELRPDVEDFTGETITYGAELETVPFYLWKHAVSLTAGMRKVDIMVENVFGDTTGEAELDVPYVGLTFSKSKPYHKSLFSIRYEENSNQIDDLDNLGRLDTVAEYELIKLDFYQSVFLDHLFSRRSRSEDIQRSNFLVHELSITASGQKTLKDDQRLIPQVQRYVGGFFSVRGYPESVVGGDDVLTASIEYRWWVTRMLKPYNLFSEEEMPTKPFGGKFNVRQPDPFSPADLDFSVRLFFDYASTTIHEIRPEEADNELMSVGIGLNFQLYKNLSIRVDYGYALENALRREELRGKETISDILADEDAAKGKSRVHILVGYAF